jgi:hypothetical protein
MVVVTEMFYWKDCLKIVGIGDCGIINDGKQPPPPPPVAMMMHALPNSAVLSLSRRPPTVRRMTRTIVRLSIPTRICSIV